MKAIINANIYDFITYKEDRYLLYENEIIEIGHMRDFNKISFNYEEIYDCGGMILLPGLVNCHTHIYSTFVRGLEIPYNPKNFVEILKQLWWRLDSQLDNEASFYSAIDYGANCIKNGVTTVIDHHASGKEINQSLTALKNGICDEMKLRGIFCFETSDRFNVDDCIKENINFSENNYFDNCNGMLGLHASMTLSDKTLKKVSERKMEMPVHVHVAESFMDEENSIVLHGKSVVKRFDDCGLINKNSILAHCIHIDEEEAQIISDRDAKAALNITSNMNNAVGLPDHKLLKENKIKCVVGNDGLGANITREYLNLLFCMKNKFNSPTSFGEEDLKQLIINGYELVSELLKCKIDKLEVGFKADMIAVPYDSPTMVNEKNIMSHLVFGVLDNFSPKHTWCDGVILMKDYKLVKKIQELYRNMRLESQKVWIRIGNR